MFFNYVNVMCNNEQLKAIRLFQYEITNNFGGAVKKRSGRSIYVINRIIQLTIFWINTALSSIFHSYNLHILHFDYRFTQPITIKLTIWHSIYTTKGKFAEKTIKLWGWRKLILLSSSFFNFSFQVTNKFCSYFFSLWLGKHFCFLISYHLK